MAVERSVTTKDISLDIGALVNQQNQVFANMKEGYRARVETAFQQKVLDLGLSAADQMDYYKQLLTKEEDERYPDNTFISAIKTNLSTLGKISRTEKFYNNYRASFEQLKTQQINYDDHINFLQNQLDNAIDQDLKTEVEDRLSEAKVAKFDTQNTILTNKVKFAINDKRVSVLEDAIKTATKARNDALVAGREDVSTAWDLNIQNLNSQLNTSKVADKVHAMELEWLNKDVSPIDMLNTFSKQVREASGIDVPMTIDGVRYDNEKQYWQMQQNSYVENSFFDLLSKDIKSKLTTSSQKLSPLLETDLKNYHAQIETLKSNSAMTPYLEKLNAIQTDTDFYGVQLLGSKVVQDYKNGNMGSTSALNITNTLNKLNELNKSYNVDVSTYLQGVMDEVVGKKTQTTSQMLQTYQQAIADGQTPSEAWKLAEQTTIAIDVPPSDVLAKSPLDIAKKAVKSTTEPSPQYDIKNLQVESPQPKVSAPVFDATLYGPEGRKQGVVIGSPEAANLQKEGWGLTPGSYKDPNFVQPVSKTPTPAVQLGEKIPNKELLSWVKPEDIINQGGSIYFKQGVQAPYKKVLNEQELQTYRKQGYKEIKPAGSKDIYVKLVK